METSKFNDQSNTAVITTKKIVSGEDWIGYVTHDISDGSWQFHSVDEKVLDEKDGVVVSLKNILDIDPTTATLADLPLGWEASRSSKDSEWEYKKI